MSYQLKDTRLKPFVAVEPYFTIFPVDDDCFRKIRYFAGFSFGFGRHTFDGYYLREDYRIKPLVNNVIAIDYHMSF